MQKVRRIAFFPGALEMAGALRYSRDSRDCKREVVRMCAQGNACFASAARLVQAQNCMGHLSGAIKIMAPLAKRLTRAFMSADRRIGVVVSLGHIPTAVCIFLGCYLFGHQFCASKGANSFSK